MTSLERLAAAGFEVPGLRQSEDRYFEPDERCPHPERWHSTDGDSTELEVTELVAAFVRALQPDLVVETGAAFGQTTEAIGWALLQNGRGKLYSIEWDANRADCARERIARVQHAWKQEAIEVVVGSSLDWTPPGPVDLLFSDSNYESRVPETLRLLELGLLRAGATAIFHDAAPDRGRHRIGGLDLREQIERDLVAPGRVRAVELPTPRGLAICQVL